MASRAQTILFNLEAKLDKFESVFKKAETLSKQTAQAMKSNFSGTSSQAALSAEQIEKKHKEAFEKVKGYAKTAGKVIAAALTAAAVAVGGFGVSNLNTYGGFEQSMANVAATAGVTQSSDDYAKLEEAALAAGRTTSKTAAESADALSYMALAGWSVDDSIEGLIPILRLSEATQADLATTSDLVTDSMSAMGLEVSQLSEYLDIAAKANNASNQTAQQMMEAVIGCGGAAKTTGVDIYSLSTALGVLANNGTKGSEAGTALNAMLVRMTSKETAINAMKALGVSAFDASGNFRGLEEVLIDLNEAMSTLSTAEQASYLSSIAGTNYYTEMSYLLDSVKETTVELEGGVTKVSSGWKDLNEQIVNADGSLETMAETVNDTYEGAVKRLKSAYEDLQISIGKNISSYLTPVINDLAAALPSFTAKAETFINQNQGKFEKLFDTLKEGALNVAGALGKIGSFAANNISAIGGAFKGMLQVFIAYKAVSTLTSLVTVFKNLGLALSGNPLMGIPVLIGGVVVALQTLKAMQDEYLEDNLVQYFGDLNLTLEETEELTKRLLENNLADFSKVETHFEKVDTFSSNIEDYVATINESHWKVNVGLTLTEEEKQSYLNAIEGLANDSVELIKEAWYGDTEVLSVVFGGNVDEGTVGGQMLAYLNNFYSNNVSELERLGTELKNTVNEAWLDGLLDIPEQEKINDIIADMTAITNGIAQADFAAGLNTSLANFNASDLSQESYDIFVSELSEQKEASIAEYTDYINRMKSLAYQQYNTFDDSGIRLISEEQLNDQLDAYNKQLFDYTNEITATVAQVQNNALGDVIGNIYGIDDISSIADELMDNALLNYSEVIGENFNADSLATYFTTFGDGLESSTAQLDALIEQLDTKGYGPMLEDNFNNLLEQAKSYIEVGETIPESIAEGLMSAAAIAAITGNEDAIKLLAAAKLSSGDPTYGQLLNAAQECGENAGDAFAVGLALSATGAISEAEGVVNEVEGVLNRDINSNPKVNMSLSLGSVSGVEAIRNQLSSALSSSVGSVGATLLANVVTVPMHAKGTTNAESIFIAGENGPEMIVGHSGSTVFPTSETSKIINAVSGYYTRYGNLLGEGEDDSNTMYADAKYIIDAFPSSYSTGNVTFAPQYNITVNGSDTKSTEKELQAMLENHDDSLFELFERFIAERAERGARLANV